MDFRDDTEPADLLNSRHGVEEISDPACRLLNRPPGYLTFCLYAWPVVFPGTWLRYFAQEDVVSHDTAIVSFLHLQTNLSAILPRHHVLLSGFRAITSCLLELAVILTCVVRSQVFRSSSSHALCSTQIRLQPLPTTKTPPAPLRPNKARFKFHPPKTKSPSHPYPSYFATSQHTSAFWLNHKKKQKCSLSRWWITTNGMLVTAYYMPLNFSHSLEGVSSSSRLLNLDYSTANSHGVSSRRNGCLVQESNHGPRLEMVNLLILVTELTHLYC